MVYGCICYYFYGLFVFVKVFNSIYDYFWWFFNINELDDLNFYNIIIINVF